MGLELKPLFPRWVALRLPPVNSKRLVAALAGVGIARAAKAIDIVLSEQGERRMAFLEVLAAVEACIPFIGDKWGVNWTGKDDFFSGEGPCRHPGEAGFEFREKKYRRWRPVLAGSGALLDETPCFLKITPTSLH